MSDYIRHNVTIQTGFKSEGGWVILSPLEATIKSKIELAGIPLKDWDINIYRGILTGYNEAFIINQKTRDELIAASSKNDEIIRPILSGKDIKRYRFNWDKKWIIFTRKGIDIDQYPSIKKYLEQYYESLRPRNNNEATGRKPGPYKWYEIQDNVAYFKDFERQKIAWGNLALNGQFALVDAGYYINAPSSFIATDQTYLVAILNSKLADFYIKQLGVTRNGGYFEYKPMFIQQLPIPFLNQKDKVFLTDLINNLKESSTGSESSKFVEAEIERFVYSLYDLTTEEINFIKRNQKIDSTSLGSIA